MAEVKVIENECSEKGFSLTELLILLSTFAIVAGFSVPMLSSSMQSWQLASDARNIATTLTYAKMSSTSKMAHYQLSFNLNGNQWVLNKLNPTTGVFEAQGGPTGLSAGLASSGIAFCSSSASGPAGFPITSSTTITFDSRGIPIDATGKPTANNIVYLSDARDRYAVTVSLSGKVQLWRYGNGQWRN
jgi:Tfp pilus assembly protein FimT